MPNPISAPNSSVYDPTATSSQAACDPSNTSCLSAPAAAGQSAAAATVTIPPVYVEGDAGAQQLIKGADATRGQRSCTAEILNATLDCATAGATALGAVAASTTVIGGVAGFALTTTMSAYCGRALRAVDDCEQ